jgi:6-phosphogluconolactonase (cycloisomerase 2 family)
MKQPGKHGIPSTAYSLALAILTLGAALFLTGCSNEFFSAVTTSTTTTGSTTWVYTTNVSSSGTGGTLTAYTNTAGTLAAISGSPITLTATPTSIVVAPNNAFLYVGTQLGVFLYTIGSGGVLTEGNSDTIIYQGPSYVTKMAIDPTSSWLIMANNDSTELDALPISSTTGIPSSDTPATATLSYAGPVQLSIAPANNNVIVALGTGGTNVFGFKPTSSSPWGSEVSIPLLKNSSAANAIAFDTTSTYAFVGEATSSTTADTLRVIAVASLGTDVKDYSVGKGPVSILPDLSGAYVYVANNTDSTISGFTYSAGALTAVSSSPYVTAASPVALVEDSTKAYITSIGYGKNPNFWVYNFDTAADGTLDIKTTTSTVSTSPSLSNAIAVSH